MKIKLIAHGLNKVLFVFICLISQPLTFAKDFKQSGINVEQANQFNRNLSIPQLNFPSASIEFYESGDVKRHLTEFYVNPEGKSFGVDFFASVGSKNLKASKINWQVSSIAFPTRSARQDINSPRGLLLTKTTSLGKYTINFGQIARLANLADAPAASSQTSNGIDLSGVQSLGIQSSFKKKKYQRLSRKQRNIKKYNPIPQLRAFGDRSFYVRAIPIFEVKSPITGKPVEIKGVPSATLPVYWAKIPPNGFVFNEEEFDLELTKFEFTPYVYIDRWPSGCKDIPRDEGKSAVDVIKDAPGFVKDAINWASESYASIKSGVIRWTARMIPLVNEQMVAIALDAALASAGIPPSLPNLDQLMSGGADYLAMQMASQIPVPAGGVLAEMAVDEAREEVRQRAKKALLEAADDARKHMAASVVYCRGFTELPFLNITITNDSKKKTHRNIYVDVNDDKRLFENTRIKIDMIRPNESITLPVFFVDKPNIVVRDRSQMPGVDYDKAESEWWTKYQTTKFRFNIHAAEERTCYGNACGVKYHKIYTSPKRNYFNGKAYKRNH